MIFLKPCPQVSALIGRPLQIFVPLISGVLHKNESVNLVGIKVPLPEMSKQQFDVIICTKRV